MQATGEAEGMAQGCGGREPLAPESALSRPVRAALSQASGDPGSGPDSGCLWTGL